MRLMQNNLLTCFFAIPEIRRFVTFTQLEFFVSENFEIAMKNCQEMWALYFRKTLKNLASAQLREIRRNQVVIRYANFDETFKNSW
jgi:hypothetical protein